MMSKQPALDRITLSFDLHDLPTAQHRAGLAGLILQIDAMGEGGDRRATELCPELEEVTATSARITFTEASMQGVFDELYAAKLEPVVVAKKWPGKIQPLPGEYVISTRDPKTGKTKDAPGFCYNVVQPQAPCIQRHLQHEAVEWLHLWRKMIWEIPRGGNNVLSRAPFNDVASKGECGEGAKSWTQIQAFQEKLAKSQFQTQEISGALLLGAQAMNAEPVPFTGRVDQNLLLHFWQIVVLTFIPQTISKKDAKFERNGYVLAIPDVANLVEFRRAFPLILGSLPALNPGQTRAKASIDLPGQASLEVLRKLESEGADESAAKTVVGAIRRNTSAHNDRLAIRALAAERAARVSWSGSVRAVESYHMVKLGNNVKIASFERVDYERKLIEEYRWIESGFRNPLFRAARLRSLLSKEPWHSRMIELFSEYPWTFFVEGEKSPRYLPRFGRDAKDLFHAFYQDTHDMKLKEMDEKERLQHLAVIIQRLVKTYVQGRAASKIGMKFDNLPHETVNGKRKPAYAKFPRDFKEKLPDVCSSTFLAMRSRHDEEFVAYFAGTICSVAQYLRPEDYQFLIQVLMTKSDPNPVGTKALCWEDVKAIAMVAVSAASFQFRPREAQVQGSPS